MRKMINSFEGKVFYESSFDPKSGTTVRIVESSEPKRRSSLRDYVDNLFPERSYKELHDLAEKWRTRFPGRDEAFSQVPETIDVSVTSKCGFGCDFCYMDSKPRSSHYPKDHAVKVIKGFKCPPYQMALGGGEPTSHPDFPEILHSVRETGAVPNYTTAGHIYRPEVIEATNAVCGGVSITYHSFKGIEWFSERYKKLKDSLRVQLNVHLIADKNVATNLADLRKLQEKVGKLSLILLAYYPNVGRGHLQLIMPKQVYNVDFPEEIKKSVDSGMKIAFSEGLLPYFISRPNLGVNTQYASRAEGLFSCYVDHRGRLYKSSFERDTQLTKLSSYSSLQEQWEKLRVWPEPYGSSCDSCAENYRCTTPNMHHYLVCSYASHNEGNPPLNPEARRQMEGDLILRECLKVSDELEAKLGRKLTEEESHVVFTPYRKFHEQER